LTIYRGTVLASNSWRAFFWRSMPCEPSTFRSWPQLFQAGPRRSQTISDCNDSSATSRYFIRNWAEFVIKPLSLQGLHAGFGSDQVESGTVDINILMLSIVSRGVSFPVVWSVLPKAGNSDTTERETVIEIFIDLFGAFKIACLLGDREFIGKAWFRFLKEHRIIFQMRLHKYTLVRNGRGQFVQAWHLFCRTRLNCPLVIPTARRITTQSAAAWAPFSRSSPSAAQA
jgi:hypothetical protein